MMKCARCGSYAINHGHHGRDGSDSDLCDVCYWRERAENVTRALSAIWRWMKAEIEHSDAAALDDFIIELIDAALQEQLEMPL